LIISPLLIFLFLSCATVKSEIPSGTEILPGPFAGINLSPLEVKNILSERDRNFHGLKASGSFNINDQEKGSNSFEGIIFLKRPDRLRLQGLSFGTVIFDFIMKDGNPLLFLPSEGRISKIDNDKEYLKDYLALIQPYLSISKADMEGSVFLMERSSESYIIYIGNKNGMVSMKVWLDIGHLFEEREEIFDSEGYKKTSIIFSNHKQLDGAWFPSRIKISYIKRRITIAADLKKIIINPALTEEDFKFPIK